MIWREAEASAPVLKPMDSESGENKASFPEPGTSLRKG